MKALLCLHSHFHVWRSHAKGWWMACFLFTFSSQKTDQYKLATTVGCSEAVAVADYRWRALQIHWPLIHHHWCNLHQLIHLIEELGVHVYHWQKMWQMCRKACSQHPERRECWCWASASEHLASVPWRRATSAPAVLATGKCFRGESNALPWAGQPDPGLLEPLLAK